MPAERALGLEELMPDVEMKATWFVSFDAPENARQPTRKTRTFVNESDARKFAKQILAVGGTPMAGTINPHLPKRVIPSSNIVDWIEGACVPPA